MLCACAATLITPHPPTSKLQADNDVEWLNVQARSIMRKRGIPMIDLHAAVVGGCGSAPQAECFGIKECFCPHCADSGYNWLANNTIVPALAQLLGL